MKPESIHENIETTTKRPNTVLVCFHLVSQRSVRVFWDLILCNHCQEVNGISPQVRTDGNLQILPEDTSQVLEDSGLQ